MDIANTLKGLTAAALLACSSAANAILILDVDIGGTNIANITEFDGTAYHVDLSGTGGWNFTLGAALAQPDFSDGRPEIHLSVIANCMSASGCADLTVTALSDNPGAPDFAGFVDIGFVPGTGASGVFTAFTGGGIDPSSWTESFSWTDDYEGRSTFSGSPAADYWGLQSVISATGFGGSSADMRIAVPEPSVLSLMGGGLLLLGLFGRRRRPSV